MSYRITLVTPGPENKRASLSPNTVDTSPIPEDILEQLQQESSQEGSLDAPAAQSPNTRIASLEADLQASRARCESLMEANALLRESNRELKAANRSLLEAIGNLNSSK